MDPNVNENFEELKGTTKTFLQMVTDNDFYYAVFLLILLIILLKIVDVIFYPFKKRRSMLANFLKACVKVGLVAAMGLKICSLIPILQDFTSQIVVSSSLIVVVLGFVFQEGLTNIVHGFILSVFHPFKIGDRVSVTIDGERITGYVREITPRHTIIQNVTNSAYVIVPNSKMDMSVVDNSYYDADSLSTAFLDVQITYESNLEKALSLLERAVETHPLVQKARQEKGITTPVSVLVRDLASDGICLRAVVPTLTVEENFQVCSDIRRYLIECIEKDPELNIAYPHVQVIS